MRGSTHPSSEATATSSRSRRWSTDGPRDLLVLPDRAPVGRLLRARGVRLRRRDAAAVRPARRRGARHAAPDDRPGLGRQRGVAHRRGRRDLRRVPGVVRDDVLGLLRGAAARPRVPHRPRRIVRVAREEREPALAVGLGVGEHDRELRRVAGVGRGPRRAALRGRRSAPTGTTPAASGTCSPPTRSSPASRQCCCSPSTARRS